MTWLLRFLGPFIPYIAGALLAAVMAVSAWVWWQGARIDTLIQENRNLKARVETCSARVRNILEDAQDDATVDDPRDFNVPDRWLMSPTD